MMLDLYSSPAGFGGPESRGHGTRTIQLGMDPARPHGRAVDRRGGRMAPRDGGRPLVGDDAQGDARRVRGGGRSPRRLAGDEAGGSRAVCALRPGHRSRADLLSRSHAGDGERVPRRSARPDGDQAPPLRKILVLLGPTGTGKSRLAVLVAESIGGEIVGCDALQIYDGLDAATGKPTEDERRRVPHALVGTVDPRHDYSLAEYVRDADAAIAGIVARGRVPIVVGGTGLY